MNISELNLESTLIDLSQDAALLHKARECTMESMVEQAELMKTASERIDVLNLRMGPYTKTVLTKIAICREILDINGEKLPQIRIDRARKYLEEMEYTVNRKVAYGIKLDKYLEKKESDIAEVIKSTLLDSDLEQYAKIQKRLISYRNTLIDYSEKIKKLFTKKQAK